MRVSFSKILSLCGNYFLVKILSINCDQNITAVKIESNREDGDYRKRSTI